MYNKTFENLKNLCEANGISVTALCENVTGSKGNLATWKKGNIRADYLLKCAEILNVSVGYLLGNNHENSEIKTARQIIKELHSQNEDITIKEIESVTGVNYATFRCWYEGIGDYFNDKLNILAQLYKVSVDYLLGITDIPDRADSEFGSFEFALFGEVKDMTDAEKQDILDYIRYKKQKAE